MIEVKVLCPCGTKFKFDTEPVNNLVPTQVACPSCGQDVTDLANADLHQKLPVMMPAPAEKPRLRVASHAATPSPAPAPAASMPAAPAGAAAVEIPGGSSRPISAAVAKHLAPVGDRSIAFGLVGALIAGFVGMMIWFLL